MSQIMRLQEVERFVVKHHPLPQGESVRDGVTVVAATAHGTLEHRLGFPLPGGVQACFSYDISGPGPLSTKPARFRDRPDLCLNGGVPTSGDLAGFVLKLTVANR